MKNVNVEETANLIMSLIEDQNPKFERVFAEQKLDEWEIEGEEVRQAIINKLDI